MASMFARSKAKRSDIESCRHCMWCGSRRHLIIDCPQICNLGKLGQAPHRSGPMISSLPIVMGLMAWITFFMIYVGPTKLARWTLWILTAL